MTDERMALKLQGRLGSREPGPAPVAALREEGANAVPVLTIVERLEGAAENFAAEGLPFRALFTAEKFLKG